MQTTYKDLYINLIEFRKTNPIPDDVYAESHHIKPACMCRYSNRFGERVDYVWDVDADHTDNIVKLLPSEHFKAHYYLWKYLRTPKAAAALRMMMNTCPEELDDGILDSLSEEYESLRLDIRPMLVHGAKMNLPTLIERGIASNAERVDNGTHNFLGVMPWDNARVKSNRSNMMAWELMHEIYEIWISNKKCTYRKLGRIVEERLGIKCRLEGMVNVFNNPDRFSKVSVGWNIKYGIQARSNQT